MKKLLYFTLILLTALCGFSAFGQTITPAPLNQYYGAQEFNLELAPFAFHSVLEPKNGFTIGQSLESQYYENNFTATSLEVGDTDVRTARNGIIDFFATKQYFRIVPDPTSPIFGRIELFSYIGAETWLNTGAKGTSLGAGFGIALTPRLHFVGDAGEHFCTVASCTGLSARFALTWNFGKIKTHN